MCDYVYTQFAAHDREIPPSIHVQHFKWVFSTFYFEQMIHKRVIVEILLQPF